MSGSYTPSSRRPIADIFRRSAGPAVRWCIRQGIHPDLISYASIVAAAGAGAMFWLSGRWPWLLGVAPLLCYLRLWFNMLDGMVALESGTASARGEILNDLPDRISDVLIFAGVAHSGWCHPLSAYWAMILALLTAYVGVFGQAVGAKRQFGGVMSKPWRMVALHLGAWVALGLFISRGRRFVIDDLTILDFTCFAIILGCVQAVWIRLHRILEALRRGD